MSWTPFIVAGVVALGFLALIQYGFWKDPEGMYEAVRGKPHPNNRPEDELDDS